MSQRENPASSFIARHLAEQATGNPWGEISRDTRAKWITCASDLVIAMYDAGFTIPQPADPDAVWETLRRSA